MIIISFTFRTLLSYPQIYATNQIKTIAEFFMFSFGFIRLGSMKQNEHLKKKIKIECIKPSSFIVFSRSILSFWLFIMLMLLFIYLHYFFYHHHHHHQHVFLFGSFWFWGLYNKFMCKFRLVCSRICVCVLFFLAGNYYFIPKCNTNWVRVQLTLNTSWCKSLPLGNAV